jgi:hypothetical protein
VYGQCETGWVTTIGGVPTGSQASVGFAMCVDENGFVYAVSSEYRSDSLLVGGNWIQGAGNGNIQNRDFYVVKYSPSGTVIWTMYFGGKNQDYPKDAALDSEGNLYITGQFRDTLDFNGQNAIISTGTQDIFLCKISSEGIFQWVCKYGNSVARGISVDVDANGVYMAGVFFTDSIVVGDSIFYCAPPSGQSDVVVMKHDLNGNLGWSRHLTGQNSQQVGALSVNNGKVVLAGVYLEEFIATEQTLSGNSSYNYYLLSMNSTDGAIEWIQQSDGGGLSAIVENIVFDDEGNIYLSGRFNTNTISFQNIQTQNNGQYDYFILRTSSSGVPEWITSSDGSGFEVAYGIAISGNNLLVIGGFSQSSFNVGDDILVNPGDEDIFLATYNLSNGEGICAESYHGDGVEIGLTLSSLDDTVYVQGLFTNDVILDGMTISPLGNQDLFIWKTCVPCNSLTVSGKTLTERSIKLRVSPNPTTTHTQISYRTPQGTRPMLHLTDMLGRTVQTVQLAGHEGTYTLDASALGTGVYFCSLVNGAEVLATQKLSVIRNE